MEGDDFVFLKESFSMRDLLGDKGAVFEIMDDDPHEETEPNYPNGEEYMRTLNASTCGEVNDDEESGDDECLKGHPALFTFATLSSKMTNVLPDGRVKKLIVRRGIGSVVPSKSLVDVHYQAYFEHADEPFDSTYLRGKPDRLALSAGVCLPGLDVAMATMRKNEISRFLVQPDMAFGILGISPRILPNSEVLFEVELLNFVDGLEAEALTAVEKEANMCFDTVFKAAQLKYLDGNEFSKRLNFGAAISKYQSVRNMLEFANLANAEEEEKQQKFLLKIYTNLAICYVKLQSPRKACTMCQLAEKIDPKYCKALFMHGRALLMLHDYQRAQEWLKRALRVSPNNKDVNAELLKAYAKQKDAEALERLSCARMFALPPTTQNSTTQADQDMADFKQEAKSILENFRDSDYNAEAMPMGMTLREEHFVETEALKMGFIFQKHADGSVTIKKP